MNIHRIEARDLPDLWFQAVNDILDQGRRFLIDRGSYAGQTRLEYDFFTGSVKYPGTLPLLPDIPPSLGIPNPVEHDYIYGGISGKRGKVPGYHIKRKVNHTLMVKGSQELLLPVTSLPGGSRAMRK